MKSCWFKAVEGYEPDEWTECKHACESCSYYLPDPPMPNDINAQDTCLSNLVKSENVIY